MQKVVIVVVLLLIVVFGVDKCSGCSAEKVDENNCLVLYRDSSTEEDEPLSYALDLGKNRYGYRPGGNTTGSFTLESGVLTLNHDDWETDEVYTESDIDGRKCYIEVDTYSTEYYTSPEYLIDGLFESRDDAIASTARRVQQRADSDKEKAEREEQERIEKEEAKKREAEKTPTVDVELSLRNAAENTIKQCLSNPAEAKFPWFDWTYEKHGTVYAVWSSVESKNPYGVKVEYPFYIEFETTDEKITPVYVVLGDMVVTGSSVL